MYSLQLHETVPQIHANPRMIYVVHCGIKTGFCLSTLNIPVIILLPMLDTHISSLY